MRAQVSLMFSDPDLYQNFIEPIRNNKELSRLIVRCLTAYYYDEGVRALVEGTVPEVAQATVTMEDSMSVIADIRNALTAQAFLCDEAENILQGGVADMGDMLGSVNSFAEGSGVMKTEKNPYGGSVYRLTAKNQDNKPLPQDSEKTSESSGSSDQLAWLCETVTKMMKALENYGIMSSTQPTNKLTEESSAQVFTENPRQTSQSFGDLALSNNSLDFEAVSEEPVSVDVSGSIGGVSKVGVSGSAGASSGVNSASGITAQSPIVVPSPAVETEVSSSKLGEAREGLFELLGSI